MSPSRVTANRRPLSPPSDDESDEEILLVEQQDQEDSVEEEEEVSVMQDCEGKCQPMPESATTPQRAPSSGSASEEEESESEKEAFVFQERERKRKRKSLAEQSDPRSAHATQQAHSKKFLQRVCSEDDEIMISHGVSFDLNRFYDSIKKSIHFDVSKSQLSAKIKNLKRKYKKIAVKGKLGGLTPHELQVYELSKSIWGGEIGRADKKKSMQNPRDGSAGKIEPPNIPAAPSRSLSELIRSDKSLGSSGSSQGSTGQGLESMEVAKETMLEEERKKFLVAILELYLKRLELIQQEEKLRLEIMKSSWASMI